MHKLLSKKTVITLSKFRLLAFVLLLNIVANPVFAQSGSQLREKIEQGAERYLLNAIGNDSEQENISINMVAIDDRIHRATVNGPPSKGSTDVGDISWRVPTGGLRTTCMVAQSPGHSWQNVAAIGSSIGEKGIIYAAKTLALTALELYQQPKLIVAARADWKERMKGRTYFSFIPEGQSVPKKIR